MHVDDILPVVCLQLFVTYKFFAQRRLRLPKNAHVSIPARGHEPQRRLLSKKSHLSTFTVETHAFLRLLIKDYFARIQIMHLNHATFIRSDQVSKVLVYLGGLQGTFVLEGRLVALCSIICILERVWPQTETCDETPLSHQRVVIHSEKLKRFLVIETASQDCHFGNEHVGVLFFFWFFGDGVLLGHRVLTKDIVDEVRLFS